MIDMMMFVLVIQIRVRAGVLSNRNPYTISYGPFTKWERVGGNEAISK